MSGSSQSFRHLFRCLELTLIKLSGPLGFSRGIQPNPSGSGYTCKGTGVLLVLKLNSQIKVANSFQNDW